MKKCFQFPLNNQHPKKNLSIENSLITIKDFSEENKEEKQKKFKFFNFDENLSSHKKQMRNMLEGSDRLESDRESMHTTVVEE